jgi:hypothetical protein
MWKSIAELDNTSGVDGKYTYQKTVGYSKSIEKSEASTQSISQTLSVSAGGALKGLDLGVESETTMTSEFSSSVSNAMSGTFTTTETLSWAVPAHTCLQILQIQVSQDDVMSNIQNMNFYGSMTKIRNCPGGEESSLEAAVGSHFCRPEGKDSGICDTRKSSWESDACDNCKRGSRWSGWGGFGNHWCCTEEDARNNDDCSCYNAEAAVEEAVARQHRFASGASAQAFQTESAATSVITVVNVFAAIGLSVSIYGAFRHYIK